MASSQTVISELASSLGRRDETPNLELALRIVQQKDQEKLYLLIALLVEGTRPQRQDAIKVIYEVAAREPGLVASHASLFLRLLNEKNNRLQWGAMTALQHITPEIPEWIFANLPAILHTASVGTVITRDQAVGILIHLLQKPEYEAKVWPGLITQLVDCPPNQFPMYVEQTYPFIPAGEESTFLHLLESRMEQVPVESKKKRIRRTIRALQTKLSGKAKGPKD